MGRRHFKVHTSIQNHRHAAFWSVSELRAAWLGLGVLAVEKYADRNGDRFYVNSGELMDATCTKSVSAATKRMEALSRESQGRVRAESEGGRWVVTFTNFAEKQRFKPRYSQDTRPSASASASATAEERERAPKRDARTLNLLSKEAGTEEQKRAFLEAELSRIEDEARAAFPKGEPSKQALNAKIRSMVIGWYRQRLKGPSGKLGDLSADNGKIRAEQDYQRTREKIAAIRSVD